MAAVPPVPPMTKLRYTADLTAGFAFSPGDWAGSAVAVAVGRARSITVVGSSNIWPVLHLVPDGFDL